MCENKIILEKKTEVKETCLLNKYKETNCIFFFFPTIPVDFSYEKNVNLKLVIWVVMVEVLNISV